jgi:hypothetical protein
VDNLENQSQSDFSQQNRPRRKNALSYEECLKIEKETEKANQNNVGNKLKVNSLSQLNLNDKIVKK